MHKLVHDPQRPVDLYQPEFRLLAQRFVTGEQHSLLTNGEEKYGNICGTQTQRSAFYHQGFERRHFLTGNHRFHDLSGVNACQCVRVSPVLQFDNDKAAGDRLVTELEPKVEDAHRFQIDENIGVLDGDSHVFGSVQRSKFFTKLGK